MNRNWVLPKIKRLERTISDDPQNTRKALIFQNNFLLIDSLAIAIGSIVNLVNISLKIYIVCLTALIY